jgi:hypothetical protein
MMFSSLRCHPLQLGERSVDLGGSRAARHASDVGDVSAATAGSTFRIEPSPPSGESAVSVNLLTPTTIWSPPSMRRMRSVWLRTRRPFSSSIASKAPPSDEHVLELGLRLVDQLRVRASITWEPSNRSPYSSRSVS